MPSYHHDDSDLHIVEIKIRLKPADADLVRAIARKTRTAQAVVLRRIIVNELDRYSYDAPAEGADRDSVLARKKSGSPT